MDLEVYVPSLPVSIYRVIQNDCRGFNNLSYTIHLRQEYVVAPMDLEVYVPSLPVSIYRVIQNDCRGFNNLSYTINLT